MKAGYLIIIFAACYWRPARRASTRRSVSVPDDYIYGRGFSEDTTRFGPEWWTLFGDTVLNNLVARALDNNRDVAVAASRVEEARAEPQERAGAVPAAGRAGRHGRGRIYARHEDRAVVRRRADRSRGSWRSSGSCATPNAPQRPRSPRRSGRCAGVRLALAAEVATTYFTLLEYERDLAIARQTLRLRRESAALIDSMFRYGMSDGVALEQARSLVYTAEADIPQYRRAVAQTRLSTRHPAGRNAARERDSRGSGTAPADRLPSGGHSRGTALGAAQTAPRHHARRISTCSPAAAAGRAAHASARFPSICADGQRRSSIQFDQRFNCGEPLGVGCAGFCRRRSRSSNFGKLRNAEQRRDGGATRSRRRPTSRPC